jgi:hypothetical protein
MGAAKIQFSEEESEVVKNTDLILTKNRIISKVCDLFGQLAAEMEEEWAQHSFPFKTLDNRAKISKGEHFKGLPYVVLDFPREFSKDRMLAIRILFWWGHYFSVTLQLKGEYKTLFADRLKNKLPVIKGKDLHISISDDEWSHEINKAHYVEIDKLDPGQLEAIIREKAFLKLVAKTSLDHWPMAGEWLWEHFTLMIAVIEN